MVTWSTGTELRSFHYEIIRNPGYLEILRAHLWAEVILENNPCLRLAWPNLLIPRPLVVVLNTWISRPEGKVAWQDRLKLSWLKRARAVIAVSDALRRRTYEDAIVIGNPYQAERFRRLPGVVKDRDFVFLGRLVSDKGASQAVDAMATLGAGAEQGCNLTIVGDGTERSELERQVIDLGLTTRVTFAGPQGGEKLVVCLNRHRFILVPSAWEEPFGNVVLEGIACGCVPVASNGGGLPDAVGGAGLLFERNNQSDFIKVLRKLVETPFLEEKLRDSGPEHLSHHQPAQVAGRYLAVLEKATRQ